MNSGSDVPRPGEAGAPQPSDEAGRRPAEADTAQQAPVQGGSAFHPPSHPGPSFNQPGGGGGAVPPSYGPPTAEFPNFGAQPPPRRPKRRGVAALVAVALAAGLIGGGAGAAGMYLASGDQRGTSALEQPVESKNASVKGEGDVQSVAKKVLPSTVYIEVRTQQGGESGSGVILSSDGYILTNNHVAAGDGSGDNEITVKFNDNTTAKAKVVGLDPVTDLAVIKAEGVSDLQPAELGTSSDASVGQDVVAIGSPFGQTGTVTSGIISSLHRPVNTGDAQVGGENTSTVMDAIQTDAAINPGNSGGPLVNAAGQIIGVNTAIAQVPTQGGGSSNGNIGIGYAIPIDQAKPIVKQLMKNGKAAHAQLNVSVSQAPSGVDGAPLVGVNDGGAGDKAGLKTGDVVTKIGDRAIENSDGLMAAVRSHRPGDKVKVTYVRDGKEHTTEVTLDSDGGNTEVPKVPEQGGQQPQFPGQPQDPSQPQNPSQPQDPNQPQFPGQPQDPNGQQQEPDGQLPSFPN